MSALDQIVYRLPEGTGTILPVAASFRDRAESARWQQWLDPWLQAGGPEDRGYLNFGTQAALLRWRSAGTGPSSWRMAHVLVGTPTTLSSSYALQLPTLWDLPPRTGKGQLPQLYESDPATRSAPSALENRARSSAACEVLVPLLSRVLTGDQSIVAPWTAPLLAEAVLWGLVSILTMLGDARPVSFLTYASGQLPDLPGLLVTFRHEQARPVPDPRYEQAAIGLATSYADGPEELRRMLTQHGIGNAADQNGRIARLLDLWPPRPQPPARHGTAGSSHAGMGSTSNAHKGGTQAVICPICLQDIKDWESLPRWHWDSGQNQYVKLEISADASEPHRNRERRAALVRCPDQLHVMQNEHYLPAEYGQLGPPVVLGFVGLTRSGKSHLLAAMVGAIQRGDLRNYGIDSYPLDYARHKVFLEEYVWPLLEEHRVIPGTQEGIVTFADAFVITPASGPKRPVALFDVAGGELTKVDDTKRFLDIADGLFFVVDPAELKANGRGDETFNTILDLLKPTSRLHDRVSAAIVLNKADMVRFEEPAARLLRSDSKNLDAAEFLSESADVYAFLSDQGAVAWARPYAECAKATLHVASPTGGAAEGDAYPRGVTPRRVLRPLVAMLAMTGVLTGGEAERVGI